VSCVGLGLGRECLTVFDLWWVEGIAGCKMWLLSCLSAFLWVLRPIEEVVYRSEHLSGIDDQISTQDQLLTHSMSTFGSGYLLRMVERMN
jgi:hypothetical protein